MSTVRITGGQWRSRRLRVIDAPGLRPTPDRVRETLFNWLGQHLDGATCLDLFSGSGVLGFETASRGARHVVLVERHPRVYATLQQHIALFAAKNMEAVCADGVKFAQTCQNLFDIVFMDPPYEQGWLSRMAPLLPRILSPSGQLYIEAESPVVSLGQWHTVKQGRAGQAFFHLLEKTQT